MEEATGDACLVRSSPSAVQSCKLKRQSQTKFSKIDSTVQIHGDDPCADGLTTRS